MLESNAGTVRRGDEVEVHMSAYLKLDLSTMHVNSNKHPAWFGSRLWSAARSTQLSPLTITSLDSGYPLLPLRLR